MVDVELKMIVPGNDSRVIPISWSDVVFGQPVFNRCDLRLVLLVDHEAVASVATVFGSFGCMEIPSA